MASDGSVDALNRDGGVDSGAVGLGLEETVQYPLSEEAVRWQKVQSWSAWYGIVTFIGVVFGIIVAHVSHLTTCGEHGGVWCVLAFHLFEVPFVLFLAGTSIFAIFFLHRRTLATFVLLVQTTTAIELVFFVFEVVYLIDSLRRAAPTAEPAIFTTMAILFLIGSTLGVLVQLFAVEYRTPSLDPRFEHPGTESELVALVRTARATGRKLRVRGAMHSVTAAIVVDDGINVQLDRYTKVGQWHEVGGRMRVTAEAGCHLGRDPNDPLSTWDNSLLQQLDRRGFGLPDLGGITHQTVGGFLSTGSTGGTTRFDFGEAIVEIRLIDGTGRILTLRRPGAQFPKESGDGLEAAPEDERFWAAGVSLGLLGVVSTVTFECDRRFDIKGHQTTTTVDRCAIKLFEPRELESFFDRVDYSRILWWPQTGLHKIQVWQADRATGPITPNPFVSVPGGDFTQFFVNLYFRLVARLGPPYSHATQALMRTVLGLFTSDGTQDFADSWYKGLPMDNQICDILMPTEFTELFFDIERSADVMQALRTFFKGDRNGNRIGSYATEIYPACPSKFWLSPTYGRKSIRVDVFYFAAAPSPSPDESFYPQYWNMFFDRALPFRFHWGKFMSAPASVTGRQYVRKQYPRWDDFMRIRRELDPDGVFLTPYWAQHLDTHVTEGP
jgi:FAD/FMN-containing dehydrogenase